MVDVFAGLCEEGSAGIFGDVLDMRTRVVSDLEHRLSVVIESWLRSWLRRSQCGDLQLQGFVDANMLSTGVHLVVRGLDIVARKWGFGQNR